MRTIKADKLTNVAMVTGGERRVHFVIDGANLKEWVGFGWIIVRRATAADRRKFAKVTS